MSAAEVALLPQTFQLSALACVCLVVYDQILTLPDEIEHIWRRKVNIVNLLFFANRFALISWTALQIYANLNFRMTSASEPAPALLQTTIGCGIASNLDTVMQILISLIQAVFIGLRLYALSGKKWTLCVIICAFSLLPGQMNFSKGPQSVVPVPGAAFARCGYVPVINWTPTAVNIVTIWTLIGSSVLALADIAVIIVTYRKMRSTINLGPTNGNSPLTIILLRDGILHFAILFFLNAASAIPSVIQSEIFIWVSDILLMFQVPLEAIIVSHFLLDLREAASIRTHYDTIDVDQAVNNLTLNGGLGTRQSSLKFAAFVVPMGGSLDIRSYSEFDDDESDESASGHSVNFDTRTGGNSEHHVMARGSIFGHGEGFDPC